MEPSPTATGGRDDVITDETCRAFSRIQRPLDPAKVHRFIVGVDRFPQALEPDDARAELGDPFATLLLLDGKFPRSADELLAMIDAATPADDPLRTQMSFLLGESSQLPVNIDRAGTNGGLRFLVSRGRAPEGIDLLISAGDPMADIAEGGLVEVMAWDRRVGGFNYYRNAGAAWVFAGNARHALEPASAGKGPFESHPTGSLLMKELKFPWLHWHSPAANIFAEAFDQGDPRTTHPWFTNKLGADVCELSVAIPSIERQAKARFAALVGPDGTVDDPRRVVSHVLVSATANIITSRTTSAAVGADTVVDLPPTFFVDSDALSGATFDLAGPPNLDVRGDIYLNGLTEFGYALVDSQAGFRHPADPTKFGDTHFAFAVPERAHEDQVAIDAAIKLGLLSPRLVAALLMVDFPNPVFSRRRAALMAHAPEQATVVDGASSYSDEIAERILAAATSAGTDSPEAEFAARWNVGEEFTAPFNDLLAGYYAAVSERLATPEGYLEILRLAESRRNRLRELPIAQEFELLLARPATEIAPEPLVMRADGTMGQDEV